MSLRTMRAEEFRIDSGIESRIVGEMDDAFDVRPLKNLAACNAGFDQEKQSGEGHDFFNRSSTSFSLRMWLGFSVTLGFKAVVKSIYKNNR